jgi:epoxyqueuosine reductase
MTLVGLALTRAVKARALELGFDRVAVGPATPPPHAAAFERWLDAGYAGTMAYLARTRAARVDPGQLLSGARSVVAVALSYNPGPGQPGAGDWAPVARYARGRDYHDLIRPRLQAVAAFVDAAAAARSRAAVDTSAVLERDLAARAGLGWIGKNTNLLSPDLGSYFFIGIVLTTAALEPDAEQPDRCGTCTACLEACPTGAFAAPWVLDSRRCISYLTIEHRGDIPGNLAARLGDWVFGCDVCQDVCPWNRKAPAGREPALRPAEPLGTLAALIDVDEAAFRARFRGSAIWRAKRRGLVRNVALTLGSRRARDAAPALRRLLGDADAVVRRAAAWALRRIESAPGQPRLR